MDEGEGAIGAEEAHGGEGESGMADDKGGAILSIRYLRGCESDRAEAGGAGSFEAGVGVEEAAAPLGVVGVDGGDAVGVVDDAEDVFAVEGGFGLEPEGDDAGGEGRRHGGALGGNPVVVAAVGVMVDGAVAGDVAGISFGEVRREGGDKLRSRSADGGEGSAVGSGAVAAEIADVADGQFGGVVECFAGEEREGVGGVHRSHADGAGTEDEVVDGLAVDGHYNARRPVVMRCEIDPFGGECFEGGAYCGGHGFKSEEIVGF